MKDFWPPEICHSGHLVCIIYIYIYIYTKYIYIYIYRSYTQLLILKLISGRQKSRMKDFWRPEIPNGGFLAARNSEWWISGRQKIYIYIYIYNIYIEYMYIWYMLCSIHNNILYICHRRKGECSRGRFPHNLPAVSLCSNCCSVQKTTGPCRGVDEHIAI